jgi:hypothetical protein
MNISITLTALKNQNQPIDSLCNVLDQLDYLNIDTDSAMRIKDLLPKDETEIKPLLAMSDEAIVDLPDADQAVYKLMQVKKYREKSQSLIFLTSWESSLNDIDNRIVVMSTSLQSIMSSKGFEEIIHTIMAIGNAMRQSGVTNSLFPALSEGAVPTFSLSNLSKLHTTRSVDGTCTILDCLIQILQEHQQRGEEVSSLALDVDKELGDIVGSLKAMSPSEMDNELKRIALDYSRLVTLLREVDINTNNLLSLSEVISARLSKTMSQFEMMKDYIKDFEKFYDEKDGGLSMLISNIESFLSVFKRSKDRMITAANKAKVTSFKVKVSSRR